jgi:hypothetical protein
MTSLSFLLLLCFSAFCFSAPVVCGDTGAVSVLGSGEIAIPPKKYKCNPNHVCRFECQCVNAASEKIYLDLKSWGPFKNVQNQKLWKDTCDHISVEEYVDVEIKQKHPGIDFGGVENIFQQVISQYKDLCSGGNLPSQASLEAIKAQAIQQLQAPYRSRIAFVYKQFVSDSYSIVNTFLNQVLNHKFEHCSCAPFFAALGYKPTNGFWENLENQCKAKCPVPNYRFTMKNTISLEYE